MFSNLFGPGLILTSGGNFNINHTTRMTHENSPAYTESKW